MLLTFLGSVASRVSLIFLPKAGALLPVALATAFSASLAAPVKPLLDAAVMRTVLRRKASYGRARLFGQVGFGAASYLAGLFLGRNIRYIAVIHVLFSIPTTVLMLFLLPVQTGSASLVAKSACEVVGPSPSALEFPDLLCEVSKPRMPELIMFISSVLAIGILSGIIENFAFNRIVETSAVAPIGNHFGLIPLAASLAGAPVFWMSGRIISLLGIPLLLNFSLLSYIIRLFIYAYLSNPWHAVPAEMLRGATFASFWAASTYYVYGISPVGHEATMVSFILHFNLSF